MQSPARRAIQKKFEELAADDRFQLVNTVMGAAVPGSAVFVRTAEGANRADTGETVRIRPGSDVEVVSESNRVSGS